jgi:class 3 adenylate cyclase/tetratricopeptide (TPR) repeat protein
VRHAPELILRSISHGELAGSFPGAAVTADIRGFTSRFQGMAGMGTEGAEQISREVSDTLSGVVEICSTHGGFPVSFAGDAVTVVFPDGVETAGRACGLVHARPSGISLPLKTTVGSGQVIWDAIPRDSWTFFSFQGSALSLAADDEVTCPVAGGSVPAPVSQSPVPGACFLPPDLFPEGVVNQFRQVTSIFLSIENRAGCLCPREFQTKVLELAGEMGGFVSGLHAGGAGQRLLVVFGAPVTREDDPDRADSFLRGVFSSASGRVRAGAATGLVFSGAIRTPMLESYTVLGPSVNLAARLHDAAVWNSVYGDPVFNQSSRLGMRSELGLTLKGFSGVVNALVLSPWKQRRETRGSTPPLIERGEVLELVERDLSGSSVLLQGDTGMGKTRLVEELQRRRGDAFFMNLRCRSLPASGSDIFGSWFGEWLGGRDRQEGLPAFKEKLYGFIGRLEDLDDPAAFHAADELLRAESFLAALVGLGWERSLYEGLDPQGRFSNTVAALASFIRGNSLLGPMVVTVDDLQWISPDSLGLLSAVLAELGEHRPPLLLLSRPDSGDTVSALGITPRVHELRPLSLDGSRAFLQWSLGRAPSDDLLEWFHKRTEGIPFFMEHYAGMLESAESPPCDDSFPGSLHALLVARLDRLGPELRRAVLCASVLGREFDREILDVLCPEGHAGDLVERGVRERVWRVEQDGSCSFVHILLREAAYRLQLQGERLPLHEKAADGMARLWGDKPERAAIIAHHMEMAGRGADAADWYMRAGEYSLSRRMTTSCRFQLEKVLEFSSDPAQRMTAHRLLFDLVVSTGDIERANEAIDRAALETRDDPSMQAVIKLMRANLAVNGGRPGDALEHLRGLEDMNPSLRPEVMHLRGRISVLEGRNDIALELLLDVYREFRSGTPEERLLAYKALGNACGCMLRLRERLEQAEESLKMVRDYAREAGNLLMETLSVGNLALVYKYLPNRMMDAMRISREHMELARRTGSRLVELQATGNLGSLMEKLDPSPEAFGLLERSVELARRYGGGDTLSIALANLASACGRVGRREDACRLFSEVLEVCREHGLGLHRVDYALEMSNVLVDMGRLDEAEGLINQVREWGFPEDYVSYYSCSLGKLLVARGRNGEAARVISEALSGPCDALERFDLLRQLYLASGDREVLARCLSEGDLLQKEHPHWDTAAKLAELRSAAGLSESSPLG